MIIMAETEVEEVSLENLVSQQLEMVLLDIEFL
jgi:hypothetical protein